LPVAPKSGWTCAGVRLSSLSTDVGAEEKVLSPGLPCREVDRGFSVRADLVGPIRPVYVALAERERCELVTADTRRVATLKPFFSFIIDLASLP
jgi:hypothetical protein